jgi:hypothetical protein
MFPGKVPTSKLGQNFWQNFCNHITKADIPNWGKIFVKNFRHLRLKWDIPHWGNF